MTIVAVVAGTAGLVATGTFLRQRSIAAGSVELDWMLLGPVVVALGLVFAVGRPSRLAAVALASLVAMWIGVNVVRISTLGMQSHGWLGVGFRLYPWVAAGVGIMVLAGVATVIVASTAFQGHWVDSLHREVDRRMVDHPAAVVGFVEAGVLAYLLVPSKLQFTPDPSKQAVKVYTMWLESGQRSIIRALAGVIFVEAIIVHVGLQYWLGPRIAGAATALSIYSLLWLVGDGRAVRAHPLVLTESTLEIRIGLRTRASIKLTAIDSIKKTALVPEDSVKLVAFGAGNVVITLNEPTVVERLLGSVEARSMVLYVDNADEFVRDLRDVSG